MNNSSLDYAGSIGDYWLSLLNTDGPDGAWRLSFGSKDLEDCFMVRGNRCCGRSVRAVRTPPANFFAFL